MPSFSGLTTDAGLKQLNTFLASVSYIEGFQPSQSDVKVWNEVRKCPDAKKYPHAARWWRHIASYPTDARKAFAGNGKNVTIQQGAPAAAAAAKKDDDDIDLFGDDDDDDGAAEALKKKREAEKAAKAKSGKAKPTAKSNLILDVKPWDDETDMDALEKHVRSLAKDGLLWGASKLVAVGYGIKKLQISVVIEDDKISTDDLEDHILSGEEWIQSMDIAAFNKV